LVDGGILSTIPGDVVQQAGIDIVIGVDLRTNKNIFNRSHVFLRRSFHIVKRLLLLDRAGRMLNKLESFIDDSDFFNQYPDIDQLYAQNVNQPGMFAVLGRAMDLAIETQHKEHGLVNNNYNCDLVISPEIPKRRSWKKLLYLDMMDLTSNQWLYELGRNTGEEYAPKIWQLMADHQVKQQQAHESLKNLVDKVKQ
jgi:hypothetical protein